MVVLITSSVSVFLIISLLLADIQLNEPPRIADEEVALASILEPFSNIMEPLFHSTTPCCNHLGRYSNAILILLRISIAVACLFARIATFTF